MKYLLDTNICIYLINGNAVLEAKVSEIGISSLAISNTVLAELYFGAWNSRKKEKNIIQIENFKKYLNILPHSERAAEFFGEIKSYLKSKGEMIEDFDILIASVALAQDCIIVTNNTNHFDRIVGLRIENWLK